MRIPRWKVIAYALVVILGVIPAVPNLLTPGFRDALPDWLPQKQITLGLDLRGGSHLVLEVDANALVQERLQSLADDAKAKLREAGAGTAKVEVAGEAVVVALADPAQRSEAARLLRSLSASQSLLPVYGGQPTVEVSTPAAGEVRLTLTESGLRDRINAAVEQIKKRESE